MNASPLSTRTRLAPTPSGFIHLGNVYSFLTTLSLAEQTGAKILLRIDDIDRDRIRPEYVADIFETLQFLGLAWHEGPQSAADFFGHWSQHNRLASYEQALRHLADAGAVFACDCSRGELDVRGFASGCAKDCRERGLDLETRGVNWRLRTDDRPTLTFRGHSGESRSAVLPPAMREFIVRKKDGLPAYQVASLIDDVTFGVDLIVRGEDLLPSTLAQLLLARHLGLDAFLNAGFVHHPLLTGAGGAKLSKSAGDTSVRYLRAQGLGPSDIRDRIAATSSWDH